eukprot:7462026-Lingulodinium_polyedra.AAC.1
MAALRPRRRRARRFFVWAFDRATRTPAANADIGLQRAGIETSGWALQAGAPEASTLNSTKWQNKTSLLLTAR